MYRLAKFLEALHASRQLAAERVIRQHWHLVEEARDYERRREMEAAVARERAAISRGAMMLQPRSAS